MWFCGFGPFMPRFFGVLGFKAQFCGFLHNRSLWLLVIIVGSLRFPGVVNGFW